MDITVTPEVTPTFTQIAPFCEGTTAPTLPTTSTNGIAGTWNPATVDNTTSGTYTFTPGAGGCTTTETMDITVTPETTPTFNAIAAFCEGTTAPTLPTVSTNGIAGTWNPATVDNTTSGTYTFTPDAGECATTQTMDITVNSPPTLSIDPVADLCASDNSVSLSASPAGGTFSGNGVTGTSFNPTNAGTGTHIVTYYYTDGDGCSNLISTNIEVLPPPTVDAGNDITVCEGESVVLSGSGAGSYSWDNNVINDESFVPPSGTTVYTLTGTNGVGSCSDTDELTVTTEPQPTVSFDADVQNGCAPLTVQFTSSSSASSQCTYTLSDGTQLNGCNAAYTFVNPGCYDVTLTVENNIGCSSSSTMTDYICVDSSPEANFTSNPEEIDLISGAINFNNASDGADTYHWNFGDGTSSTDVNPAHEFDTDQEVDEFIVELIAYSDLGCSDTVKMILPFNEGLIYYVPNTFTPDEDNYNEVFKPIFTSGFDPQDYNLKVFNRWGEIIFESNDAEYGWDGTYGVNNSKIVSDGIYVWKIEFKTLATDERKTVAGHVNVIK
jgi:gliding motility-associated-like protein